MSDQPQSKGGGWKLAGMLGLAAVGMVLLLSIRFNQGDVYPDYSSFRTDPMGTKVLFEALKETGRLETSRNLDPLLKADTLGRAALLIVGLNPHEFFSQWRTRGMEDVEQFLHAGGRLVITFKPVRSNVRNEELERLRAEQREKSKKEKNPEPKDRSSRDQEDKHSSDGASKQNEDVQKEKLGKDDSEKSQENPDENEDVEPEDSGEDTNADVTKKYGQRLAKVWGVEMDSMKSKESEASTGFEARTVVDDLDPVVHWRSRMHFKDLNDTWKTIYRVGEEPVLIERSYGRGSIVLASDTYFLSNEALLLHRHSRLLSWLFSQYDRVIFDEVHLHVMEAPGVSYLMRKYQLHGLLFGCLLLCLLFVWRNSLSLVPVAKSEWDAERNARHTGGDDVGGFVNLVRRHVSEKELLPICLREWWKHVGSRRPDAAVILRETEGIVSDNQSAQEKRQKTSLIKTYNQIRNRLNER